MTQGIEEPTLIGRLRGGQENAFGELFEEHAPAVRRLAMSLASDRSEAEDITAETFFRVLRAIKRGNGPTDNVRGYLLTVARRVSWEWKGAAQDVPVTDDELTSRAGVSEHAASRTAEHSLISRAFSSLPERWRTVLWQTEVEGAQPAVVAPHFGLSPNATAALARRARLGLRAAYLQAHLAANYGGSACRPVLEKLGGYTAGIVTGSEARRISEHLGTCAECRATHDELRDVCFSLRAHAGGIAVLVPATAGAALGAGTGAGSAAGATSALGAGSSSTSSGGFLSALKAAVTSTKLKVGLAVASTAAAGVFGASAGPVVGDAVGVLGLSGLRGVPNGGSSAPSSAATLEREPSPSEHGPVLEREGDVWGLDEQQNKSADKEADAPKGDPAQPDTAKPADDVKPEQQESRDDGGQVKPAEQVRDLTDKVKDTADPPEKDTLSRSDTDAEPPVKEPAKPAPTKTEPDTTEPDTTEPDTTEPAPSGADSGTVATTSSESTVEAPVAEEPVVTDEPTADEPGTVVDEPTTTSDQGATAGDSTTSGSCTSTESYYSGVTEDGVYYEVYEYYVECH